MCAIRKRILASGCAETVIKKLTVILHREFFCCAETGGGGKLIILD